MEGRIVGYLFLMLAICCEVIGAIASTCSEGFSKKLPSILVVVAIVASYYFFAASLQHGMNIGVGYAIWAGLGVILVAAVGTLWFKEKLTRVQVVGIGCIIAGVAALELGAMI